MKSFNKLIESELDFIVKDQCSLPGQILAFLDPHFFNCKFW